MEFKKYILNESQSYLAQRVGDILTALQSLQEDGPNMGARNKVSAAEGIVNQIKRVLHDSWPSENREILKALQKSGVAIMKAIEEKGDLIEVISGVIQIMQQAMMGDTETPINTLASPQEEPPE